MRKFEKISYDEFKKTFGDNNNLYDEYKLPSRNTKFAAGYDIYSLEDFTLKPTEIIKIATGVKACMNDSEVLLLVDRSSQGFKYNVRMCNQVGVVDKDYYNNVDNEGHIFVKLQNEGEKDYVVKKGDAICQGIFINYLTVDEEEENFKARKGKY